MRIAALYDIHGNLPALEAVLGEVRSVGVDQVVVGGDVLPGPKPVECMDQLLDLAASSPAEIGALEFIAGNGDTDVLRTARGEAVDRVPEAVRPVLEWTAEQLADELLEAIAAWPATVAYSLGRHGDVLFCHATPRDDNELFTEITPEGNLLEVFEPPGADLVVCGHTHMPFDRSVGRVRVVNAGSVGMPFGAPGAHWLLLTPEGIQPMRTDYDLAAAQDALFGGDYPSVLPYDLREPPEAAAVRAQFEAHAIGSRSGEGV